VSAKTTRFVRTIRIDRESQFSLASREFTVTDRAWPGAC
jgi:hypothetical protein